MTAVNAQGLPIAAGIPFLRPVSNATGPAAVPVPRDALMTSGLFPPLIPKMRPHITHALLPPQLDSSPGHPMALLAPPATPTPLHLEFLSPVEENTKARVKTLFDQAKAASRQLGMGEPSTQRFDVSFISRGDWRDKQATRDAARIRDFPVRGFQGFMARIGYWMRRQVQTFTTAISFEQGPPGHIYVVRENYLSKPQAQQDALMASALLQSLQQATYPRFTRTQSENLRQLHAEPDDTDPNDYLCGLSLSQLHVRLGLDLMPLAEAPVVVQGDSWTSKLMVWRRGPDPKMQALVKALKPKPQLAAWLNTLFSTPVYARLLFQRGGEVVLSEKELTQHKELFDTLVMLNPSHAPTRRPRPFLP